MYKPDNTSLDLLVRSSDWSNFYNWSFITFELHTKTYIEWTIHFFLAWWFPIGRLYSSWGFQCLCYELILKLRCSVKLRLLFWYEKWVVMINNWYINFIPLDKSKRQIWYLLAHISRNLPFKKVFRNLYCFCRFHAFPSSSFRKLNHEYDLDIPAPIISYIQI